jgi:hypothetical protein
MNGIPASCITLNADMKPAIGAKVPVRTKSKLETTAGEQMTTISKSPE